MLPDQKAAFDQIADSVLGLNSRKLFFLEGSGGCGKTYLYNALIRWCRSKKPEYKTGVEEMDVQSSDESASLFDNNSVISCASTGIASLHYFAYQMMLTMKLK